MFYFKIDERGNTLHKTDFTPIINAIKLINVAFVLLFHKCTQQQGEKLIHNKQKLMIIIEVDKRKKKINYENALNFSLSFSKILTNLFDKR